MLGSASTQTVLGGTLAFVWKDSYPGCQGDPPCPTLACCGARSSPVLVDLVKSWCSQSPSLKKGRLEGSSVL